MPKTANFKLPTRCCRTQNWGKMCRITLPSHPSQYNKCDPGRQVAGGMGGLVASLEMPALLKGDQSRFKARAFLDKGCLPTRPSPPTPTTSDLCSGDSPSKITPQPSSSFPSASSLLSELALNTVDVFPALTRYYSENTEKEGTLTQSQAFHGDKESWVQTVL